MNPFQLPSVSLAEKDKLPSAPGIYYVLNRHSNEIVYVGRSKNIRSRWKEHHWDWNIKAMEAVLYEQSVMVIAWEICPISQLNELENERIKTLKPRLNGLSTEKFTQDFEIEFQLEDCPKYNRYFFDSIPPGDKISARVINYFRAKANLVELFNYQHPKLNVWVPRSRHFELSYLLDCSVEISSAYNNHFYELVNNDVRNIMIFYNSSPKEKHEKLQGTNWEGYAASNIFAMTYMLYESIIVVSIKALEELEPINDLQTTLITEINKPENMELLSKLLRPCYRRFLKRKWDLSWQDFIFEESYKNLETGELLESVNEYYPSERIKLIMQSKRSMPS